MSSNTDIAHKDLETRILVSSDDLSSFNCSKDDLAGCNEFIHTEAKQYQDENLGVTHLFLYKERIVGFATLAMSEIETKDIPSLTPKTKNYPALLIGRLAVHNDYRKRNVGANICLWCLALARELSKEVGCKVVTVLTEGKSDFYKKCNFKTVPKYENKRKVWLYLQVPKIE